MKKYDLFQSIALLLAFCALPTSMCATEIEATLRPVATSPSATQPFFDPLEEVGFVFDRCIKLIDNPTVTIKCGDKVVATAVSVDIENYDGELGKQGTLIARFDKQNLPKGETYTICLPKESVGWVECYNDIQIVNMAYSYDVEVPENLGTPHSEIKPDSAVSDSDSFALCLYYGYEIAPVGTPNFLLYRDDKPICEVPADVTWDWNLGTVRPQFPEKINFDLGVRYSLVLPAGSVSALRRDDIVNEEYTLSFVGAYKESDAPFSYIWCSLFTDHSDVLDVVSFTYDVPVSVTEGAEIELYEGDCETLVKSVPAYLNTDANCWLVCCDFGGFHMTSEKGYTLVVPDGAVYMQQFPEIKAAGGKINVNSSAGLTGITTSQNENTTVYDMMGRKVTHPVPGTIYVRNGVKFIYRQR